MTFPVPGTRHQVNASDKIIGTHKHGYTVENMNAIAVPTLILTGDRDPFCTVEEEAAACRALPAGQLAVLPDTGHLITPRPCGPRSLGGCVLETRSRVPRPRQGGSGRRDQGFRPCEPP